MAEQKETSLVNTLATCIMQQVHVVNYAITSYSLVNTIINFTVDNVNEFSHHSSISFVMKVKTPPPTEDDIIMTPHPECFVWNENLKDKLKVTLNSSEVKNKLDQLFSKIPPGDSCDINTTVNEFTDILNISCKSVLSMKIQRK